MSRFRFAVLSASLLGLAVALGWAVGGLAPYGGVVSAYGQLADRLVPQADRIPEIVTGVTYDLRSLDSLGETFILFASVLGTAMLLRERKDVGTERPGDEATGDAIRMVGRWLVPAVVVVGLWDAATAGLSPGNGFQVGVILSGAALLLWAAGSYRAFRAATGPRILDAADGGGGAAIVALGLVGMASGGAFLAQFVDPGPAATLRSGGIALMFSWFVALEVSAANVLVAHEYLEEYVPGLPSRADR